MVEQLFFYNKCIKKFLDKLFITRVVSKKGSHKIEFFISLEYFEKISPQSLKKLTEKSWTCQKM